MLFFIKKIWSLGNNSASYPFVEWGFVLLNWKPQVVRKSELKNAVAPYHIFLNNKSSITFENLNFLKVDLMV